MQDRLNSLDSIGDDADMSYIADEGNVSVESSSSPTGTISSRVQDLRLQLEPYHSHLVHTRTVHSTTSN